ncbi:macrophage mannose receptor 1-like [Neodiprion pinetum]|uniref:macrophage mannose receptor 1-like n=1 Tax=Neodiprion pinetum TaxID=441929 RepID=UPI0037215B40
MMRFIFIAILCLSLELLQHRTNAHDDAYCLLRGEPVPKREDYTYFPGVGGYKLNRVKKTWFDARVACEEDGGHLAVINSPDEAHSIVVLFKQAEEIHGFLDVAFCGFHDLFREGEFLTIHGQSLERAGFDIWHESQPNDIDNTQNCGGVHYGGTFNDLRCEDLYEFICELPDVDENDAIKNSPSLHFAAPCLLRGEPVTERDDYTYFPGVGGYKFHHVNKTWFDARLVCEEEGGHLVIVNSADEAQAIISVFKRAKKIHGFRDVAFCGFHDLFREGEYLTIHGQSLEQAGYAIWNKREPNTQYQYIVGEYTSVVLYTTSNATHLSNLYANFLMLQIIPYNDLKETLIIRFKYDISIITSIIGPQKSKRNV